MLHLEMIVLRHSSLLIGFTRWQISRCRDDNVQAWQWR